ncbi:MAG: hypothetical protein IH940_01240 [Acidobacteria bacterium]|nr:hypothetical protein [Acidobacteriota bacterium]
MKRTLMLLLLTLALVAAACGDDDDAASDDESSDETTSEEDSPDGTGVEVPLETGDSVDGTLDEIGDPGFVEGGSTGATATLIVGGEEWAFDAAFCAFGEETIGQEGAEFNVSASQDGLQLYASIDSFGHSVTLNDIDNFENPSVSLSATTGGFIVIDGKNISAEADFVDDLTGQTSAGTFSATCP